MSRQPWLTEERGIGSAVAQAIALCRAGVRRPGLVVLASLVIALLTGAYSMFGSRSYAPRFVLRVSEAANPSGNGPGLKRQLSEYVQQGVFTSQPLFEIMRRHGLYASLMRRNARAALEAFKEDISVEVYQNYFVESRGRGAAPRTVRLTVSFHAKEPQLALAVTRDLGKLIVDHELAARRDSSRTAAEDASRARDLLVGAWQQRRTDIVSKQQEISEQPEVSPRLQVELVSLLGSMGALEQQVETAERRAARLDIGAALERRGIGMYFDVVDEGSLPGRAGRLKASLVAGGVTFFFALPLIAAAVGAFSGPVRGRT